MPHLIMTAVRLLATRRVLKPSGAIFRHCGGAASRYLKTAMDCMFGKTQFQNEIVWSRASGRGGAKKFGRVHDVILYYAGGGGSAEPAVDAA